MAITMSSKAVTDTLNAILPPGHPANDKIKYLMDSGCTIAFGLFTFTVTLPATHHAAKFQATLPVMVTNFSKSAPPVQDMYRDKVASVIESALIALVSPVSQTVPNPGEDNQTATATATATAPTAPPATPTASPIPTHSAPAKPSPWKTTASSAKAVKQPPGQVHVADATVVPLAQATSMGQQVKGTTPSSVYRVVALNGHGLNIAAKVNNGMTAVSLRGEFSGKRDGPIAARLVEIGFTDNGGYLSMHLSLASPKMVMRVVGAALIGVDAGFKEILTTKEQLNGK